MLGKQLFGRHISHLFYVHDPQVVDTGQLCDLVKRKPWLLLLNAYLPQLFKLCCENLAFWVVTDLALVRLFLAVDRLELLVRNVV